MHTDRLARPRTLLVLLLALVASLGTLAPGGPASATSYGGAVSGSWPTTWTAYTYADGTVVGDTNSDQTPPYMDLVSGACTSCVGTQPSVLFANDGTSAFFRMRMAVDNNDAGKGGLFGGAFLVQIADASNTVRAVVGVDGKQSGADNVYVTNAVGGTTQIVYEYPFTGTSAGMRWIPVGDGTGQYFLDFQVPVSVVNTISGGAITPTTPIKLYYGSSAAANLATINKDLMIPGASAVDFTTLAVRKLIPPTYAVSFDSAGGSAVSGQTVTDGDPVVQPSAPTRSGHVFAGWYDGSTPWSFSTAVTGPLTLTARWTRPTHTVSFDSAGGSAVAAQSVEEDAAATPPTAPTRLGWTFGGWYDGAAPYDFTTPVTGAVALTAHWTRVSHTVTFDSDGGSAVAGQSVDHGDPATTPAAPTRTGWTFTGWHAGATPYDFTTPVTGPLALTAHWTRTTYAVTFDSNGGSTVAGQSVDHGDPATTPATPTRTGWTFTGWHNGATPYDFTTPVTGAVALTAHWTRTTYTVTFDSAVPDQTIADGEAATTPTAPTRTGWTFSGWYDGTTPYDFTTPVTGPVTLTAHWSRTTYVVTFDTEGGGSVPDLVVDELGVAAQPADPVRPGFVFLGWYDGSTEWDFDQPITAATQLSARWAPAFSAVFYDAAGGSAVADETVAYGAAATEPAAPTRVGWTFAGWYDGVTPYDFTGPVTGPVALTAHWTRITYVVTFDSDGGSAVAPQTVDHGDPAIEPAPPTRSGHTFGGWTRAGAAWSFATPVVGPLTLRARWTPVGATPHPDTDRDGLTDAQEALIGTDPDRPDTDRDGVGDGAEVAGSRNTFGHCGTDPLRADTDRDRLADGAEVRGGRLRGRIVVRHDRAVRVGLRRTDPCRADTDGDGLRDGRELRGTPVRGTTYRSDPLRRDTDRDGLSDRQEVRGVESGRYRDRVTDPMDWDTDDGGVSDGFEVRSGSDPLDIGSSPGRPRITARLGW